MITSAQLRGARGLLGWTQFDLATASGVGLSTIKRMERGDGVITGTTANAARIESSLEKAGIQFIQEKNLVGVAIIK